MVLLLKAYVTNTFVMTLEQDDTQTEASDTEGSITLMIPEVHRGDTFIEVIGWTNRFVRAGVNSFKLQNKAKIQLKISNLNFEIQSLYYSEGGDGIHVCSNLPKAHRYEYIHFTSTLFITCFTLQNFL